jgi:hypothetical protein
MALSQLLGGWTKWGFPLLSIPVLVLAFVPVAVVSLWVILAGEPGAGWFHNHALSWTRDIHASGLVTDMLHYSPMLAFGTGLVLGYSFDTTGPRVRDPELVDRRETVTGRLRSGFLGFGRRHDDDAPPAVDRDPTDAPPTAENLQPREGESEIHERIAAYTLAHAQDQPQAERRSGRDTRSGIDRRQAQVEGFNRSSERRAGGERRSGMSRRQRGA